MDSNNTQYVFNSKIIDPNKKEKKSKKSLMIIFLFLIINIGIIVYIGYTSFVGQGSVIDQSAEVFAVWKKNIKYILIALALPFLAIFSEATKISILCRHKTGIWNFRLSIRSVIMGKYYDNVTPLSSGGQPFQIYYLNKGGVPLGTATSFPFISFFLNQLALVIISVAIIIYLSFNELGSASTTIRTFRIVTYIGTLTSILVPAAIIGISVWPRLTKKIADGIVKIMNKIKFIRHKEKHANTLYRTLGEYQEGMSQYKNKKSVSILFICFFFSFIYKIALLSTPFFIIKGCGINPNFFEIFALTVIITVSVSFIPTPGGSGAAELSFQAVFASALASAGLGAAFTFWNMLYWRFLVYFFFIILGIVEMIILSLKHKRKKAYIPIPIMETLYQVPIKGVRVIHKDRSSTLIPLTDDEAKIYISDSDKPHEITPRKPMLLKSNQDFSCLNEDSYVFISKSCIQRLISKLDHTRLYGLSFVVDKNRKLGPTIMVDTGQEKSPLDEPDARISSVQFTDYYYPINGYTAKCTDQYATILNQEGISTRVLTPRLKKKLGKYESDYPIVHTPSLRFFFTDYAWAVPKYNIKLKMSLEPESLLVFHAQTPFLMGRYALKMARRYDVPIVGSFRHLYYHGLKRPLKSRLLARIFEKYGMSLYKRCDAVFVPSVETGELLKRHGYKGKYMVVPDAYEAYDDETIQKNRIILREHYHLANDEFTISTIVRGKAEKEQILKILLALEGQCRKSLTIIIYGFSFLERNKIKKDYQFQNLRLIMLEHSCDYYPMIMASDLLLLLRPRQDAIPYERIAAGYRIPSILHGFEDNGEYLVDKNCFLLDENPNQLALHIKRIINHRDMLKSVGDNAWASLTISLEKAGAAIIQAYQKVIRIYYEGEKK